MKRHSPHSIKGTFSSAEEETAVLNVPGVEEEENHLRDYWEVIRKYRWLIAIFSLAVVLTTALVIFRMTPIYTAETTLLIERKSPQVLNIPQVLSEQSVTWDEYDYYKTQYEILRSRRLAAQVIQEQDLENNSLFSGERRERTKGLVSNLRDKAKTWVKNLGLGGQSALPTPKTHGRGPLGIRSELIAAYGAMLEIVPISGTRMVKLVFNTPDPELSALLANAHAEAYIRQGLRQRTQASGVAQRFLEEELVGLKERVEKSEAGLNRYRRDKGIISLEDKENIVVERLGDLNKRLTEAEAETIALGAKVRVIHELNYHSLPEVVTSALIQAFKGQLVRLEGDYAYLAARFKPEYPRLAQLKAQVEEIQRRLEQETQRVVGGIKSAYQSAKAKEITLRAKMEEQKAAALSLKDASVEYAILAREIDTNRQLYDSVLQRMKEIGVGAGVHGSNVSIIDKAEQPRSPSKPKKAISILLSALVGLMGGVMLAFFLEYLDNTMNTREEIERHLRLPTLVVVPDFKGIKFSNNNYAPKRIMSQVEAAVRHLLPQTNGSQSGVSAKENFPSHNRLSVVIEAYRTLRTAILLSQAEEPPKTILFTSSLSREGKSSTVINTAIIFAQMGKKVLVIDADLRRSDCHKILGIENGKGLAEVLTGGGKAKEMISPAATENLFLLSSGTTPPNPTELVGSSKMHEILTSLQEHYDHIFIDSPPVIPLSDAILLSTRVDGVVLIVKGNETPRNIVKEAHQQLSFARAKFLGVVLNGVIRQGGNSAYYYDHYYSSDQPPFLPIKELLQDYDEYYRRLYLNSQHDGTEKT